MNILIGGQVLVGIGAGINELTALAVAAELAPTRKRGSLCWRHHMHHSAVCVDQENQNALKY